MEFDTTGVKAAGVRVIRDENALSKTILDAAFRVHSAVGPGLLEKAYEACLAYELRRAGLDVKTQVALPLLYKELRIDIAYRLDLLVNDLVVIELKSVDALAAIHQAQLISYLKLSRKKLGLLINFNVVHLRDGIKRVVNNL